MDNKLEFVREIFNLDGKEIEWGIVLESVEDEDGNIKTSRKPGIYIKDSEVYVDLYARRFYSIIKMEKSFERKILPAKLYLEGEGVTFIDEDAEEPHDNNMAVLIAKDDDSIDCLLRKDFINVIFGTTIYGPWMEKTLLL